MCSPKFGSEVWPNTTSYKGLLGLGKQQIVRASKHRWPESPLVQTRRIGEKKAQNDIFSSTKMASPSRYSSAQPTSMTAWLWSLYLKRPLFHRRQQRNATCAWMQGTSAKRKSPRAMASSHIYAHEERKRRRLQSTPSSRHDDGLSN